MAPGLAAVAIARPSPPDVVAFHHPAAVAQRDAVDRAGESAERLAVVAVDEDHPVVAGAFPLGVELQRADQGQVRGELDRADFAGTPSTQRVRSELVGESCTPSVMFQVMAAPVSDVPQPALHDHLVTRA